ncbi:MAG: site-specific DNA-methyltransferase [Gammaproteobacteria bacterium]|nr:site-specific DNA-methyltransferase [Gammaproteobacteria bacterium]
MPQLKTIDMILADIPYGMTSCKWDSIVPLASMWKEINRIIKPTGIIALTASQPFTSLLVISNIKMFRHEWIWLKNKGSNFAYTVRGPMKEHESVLIFSNGKWTYNKQMQKRTGGGLARAKYDYNVKTRSEHYRTFKRGPNKKQNELRVPSSWQKFNIENGYHPTQKPVALMEYMIKTYSDEGDTILDFTMGSGSTGVACQNTGRKFIGIDIEKDYCDVAIKRFSLNN